MSETGHAKNVANFQQVINVITLLGAAYDPVQALILLSALQSVLTAAQAAMPVVDAKTSIETVKVNERVAEFDGIGKLGTRIYGAAGVLVNDELFSKDVQTLVRKLRGGRAGDKPVDDPLTPDIDESLSVHSVSQQSYDNLVANFAELITLLQTKESVYKPNETDVKIETLIAKHAAMEAANTAAKIASIEADNARAARDVILYGEETGMLERVLLVKKYIAYAFGKDSPAYQQINALVFKKVK